EDQPYFAGFRALASNGIDLPVLNVFRMFGKMSGNRMATTSSAEVALEKILSDGVRCDPDVAALASRDGRRISILVWHYHDDDVAGPDASVHLSVKGLPDGSLSLPLWDYTIDSSDSNAFVHWQRLGSPSHPALQKVG